MTVSWRERIEALKASIHPKILLVEWLHVEAIPSLKSAGNKTLPEPLVPACKSIKLSGLNTTHTETATTHTVAAAAHARTAALSTTGLTAALSTTLSATITLAASITITLHSHRKTKDRTRVQLESTREKSLLTSGFLHKHNSLIENHILNRIIKRHRYNVEHLFGSQVVQRSSEPSYLNSVRHKCCRNGTTSRRTAATHSGYRANAASHPASHPASHSAAARQTGTTARQTGTAAGQPSCSGSTRSTATNRQARGGINLRRTRTPASNATATGTGGQACCRIHTARTTPCSTTRSATCSATALVIGGSRR